MLYPIPIGAFLEDAHYWVIYSNADLTSDYAVARTTTASA